MASRATRLNPGPLGANALRIEKQLTPSQLEALRLLIGESVSTLYAEGIDANPKSCVAPYLVHRFGTPQLGRFLIIESDWSDTKDEAIDYHELLISVEDRPRQIPWKLEPQGGPGGTISWPFSTFVVVPRIIVETVSVWVRTEAGNLDSVIYDAGVILRGTDSREVAVFAHESISGGLEASCDPATIQELKHDCSLRVTL